MHVIHMGRLALCPWVDYHCKDCSLIDPDMHPVGMQHAPLLLHVFIDVQEVSMTFEDRNADAAGAQQLLTALSSSCYFLRALRISAACRLNAGPLPAAMSSLQQLTNLHAMNLGVFGQQCLPAVLPAMRVLSICDQPPWPPEGNVTFPASLATLTTLTALQTTCLGYGAQMPVRLRLLHLDCARWRGPASHKVPAFQSISCLTALRSLQASGATETMAPCLPELLQAAGHLPHLRHLGVPRCNLMDLADWPWLPRVASLNMSGNLLTAVPDALKPATACGMLDLSFNAFSGPAGCIPVKDIATFVRMPALRWLGLCNVMPATVTQQDATLKGGGTERAAFGAGSAPCRCARGLWPCGTAARRGAGCPQMCA